MKLTLAIVTGIMLMSSLALGQDREAILKLLESQRQAWNRGDIDRYMQGYWQSDSLLFVGRNGPRYGWKATFNGYKNAYPGKAAMGQLSFVILKVELLGATNAFVLGSWQLKLSKDAPKGYFTLLLRKFANGWRIVADHSS